MSKLPANNPKRIQRYNARAFFDLPIDWRIIEDIRMYNHARQLSGSIRLLRSVIEENRDVAVEIYYELSRYYNRVGQDEQAQAGLYIAIEREPGFQEAISLLGHSLTCTNDFELAGHYLRLAASLDPRDHIPWARLSNLYTAMGNLDATMMAQREAVRRKPDCPMLRRRLSELILFGLENPL